MVLGSVTSEEEPSRHRSPSPTGARDRPAATGRTPVVVTSSAHGPRIRHSPRTSGSDPRARPESLLPWSWDRTRRCHRVAPLGADGELGIVVIEPRVGGGRPVVVGGEGGQGVRRVRRPGQELPLRGHLVRQLQGVLPALGAERRPRELPVPLRASLRHHDRVAQVLPVLPFPQVPGHRHGEELGDDRGGATATAAHAHGTEGPGVAGSERRRRSPRAASLRHRRGGSAPDGRAGSVRHEPGAGAVRRRAPRHQRRPARARHRRHVHDDHRTRDALRRLAAHVRRAVGRRQGGAAALRHDRGVPGAPVLRLRPGAPLLARHVPAPVPRQPVPARRRPAQARLARAARHARALQRRPAGPGPGRAHLHAAAARRPLHAGPGGPRAARPRRTHPGILPAAAAALHGLAPHARRRPTPLPQAAAQAARPATAQRRPHPVAPAHDPRRHLPVPAPVRQHPARLQSARAGRGRWRPLDGRILRAAAFHVQGRSSGPPPALLFASAAAPSARPPTPPLAQKDASPLVPLTPSGGVRETAVDHSSRTRTELTSVVAGLFARCRFCDIYTYTHLVRWTLCCPVRPALHSSPGVRRPNGRGRCGLPVASTTAFISTPLFIS